MQEEVEGVEKEITEEEEDVEEDVEEQLQEDVLYAGLVSLFSLTRNAMMESGVER